MRTALLYVIAAILLVLIVSVAWWTREVLSQTVYEVQVGETLSDVAAAHDVPLESLADANGLALDAAVLPEGKILVVPPPEPSLADTWGVHGVGLLATILGVFMSFWLSRAAGLVPKSIRGQILGISLVLGIASYSAAMATRVVNPPLTPQFVFGAVKDGFVWAAAFPMFARAFGMRDPKDPTPAPVAPGPVAAPEAEDGV